MFMDKADYVLATERRKIKQKIEMKEREIKKLNIELEQINSRMKNSNF
jgi:predicted RNase H-like nuclease (RuvC/YqgF family)